VVQFLLDVCRPSQLNATPFLRGFYFSGVRPILVRDAAPAPVVAKRHFAGDSGATGVFRIGPEPAGEFQAEGPAVRKVPQWVFLRQLFGEVVLADEAALGVSAVSVKTSILKRALLASAVGLFLLLSVAWGISFSQNRGLEAGARDAAAAIKLDNAAPPPVPSFDDLTKLDALRQSLDTISRYNREGAPLSYRWGLYIGDELFPRVRRLYFRRFFQLLFASTQAGLVSNLQSLPAKPGPTDSYQYPYDSLKSYLITTSNHDKSTKLYLSPLLYARWEAGKSNVDAARAQLVRKQFDFYSEELKFENPLSSENDSMAIERARKYLAQFAGTERVYRFMLAEVNKNAPALNFNQKFPGSAQTVVNNRDVAGAFTKTGWPVMQDAIKHADRYFAGEQWVLGDQSANIGDRAKLEDDLHMLYSTDYVDQWREYLKKSVVVPYSDIPDAAKKLAVTASSQSPLLAMFCMASQSVGVDPEISKSFKPLLTVVPASCGDQYVGPTNQDYMKALSALQVSLGQITSPDPNDPNVAVAANNASAAKVSTAQMAQGFGVDPLASTVQKLIEDPIANVEPKLKGLGAAALNKGGKNLCVDFKALMNKYPFNPQSTMEATLADVNSIFKPMEGSMWKFYDQSLQKPLPKQGNQYVAVPGGTVTLLPPFVSFFNRIAAFSNALYAGGSDPHFTYSLQPVRSEGIQSVTLALDGQSLTSKGDNGPAKQFTWPGTQSGAQPTVNLGGNTDIAWETYTGLWGVFRFFARADKPAGASAVSRLEWVIRTGDQPMRLPDGKPLTVRFDLDMGASPLVFQKGYLSSMSCVADVAK
jgi:type VI secretion system protein ImpL